MARGAVVATFVMALAACTDLGAVDRDRCGNGVVEPGRGEDCDRGDAADPGCGGPGTVAECRLLCGPAITGSPTCPDGAACSFDGVCHAPGASFGVTADVRWTARSLLVGDLTFDRYPDLIGVSDQEIVAMLGAPEGTYAASVSVPNLQVFDEPRMSDLNGDGAQDLTIPVGFGLYSLVGNPLSVLQPLFQNSFPVASSGRVVSAAIDHVITDPTGVIPGPIPNSETLVALRVPMGPGCLAPQGCEVVLLGDTGAGLPAGRVLDQIVADTIPWAWIPGAQNQRFLAVLAFVDDPDTAADDGGAYLYGGNLTVNPPAFTLLGPAAVVGRVRGQAWFADVDGDSYQDLLVATLIVGNPSVSVSWGRSDGAFDGPATLIGGLGPSPAATEPVAWGDVTGDRKADFIDRTGIRINECTSRTACTWGQALVGDRAWVDARIADVDGDGDADVVAHGAGAIVVDVLRNTGLPAVWNQAPISAAGVVKAVRTGDFDGNGIADVALITTLPGVDASDDLYVAFGTSGGGLAAPTYMGYVGTHVAIQPTTALIPSRFDAIADLLVVAERGGVRGAALVLGSTSQRMIGPLIPIGDGDADINLIEGIVSMPLDGNATADVICLISEVFDDGRPSGSVVRIFTAAADGALTERTPAGGVTLATTQFILRSARWVAIPADGNTPAFVVGADLAGRVGAIAISCTGSTCSAGAIQDLTGATRGGEPTSLAAVDLDADGDLDLVASFKPSAGVPGSPASHARVWTNSGGYTTAVEIAAPASSALAAVTAIDLDLDGRQELVALVRADDREAAARLHVARATAAGSYGAFTATPGLTDDETDLGSGITLVGGDVTGDGLPDLVGVFGLDRTAPQNLKVLVQREVLGALAGAAAGP